MDDAHILTAANWIRQAQQVAVLTGAGASKESGVPTFRDALEGLWAQYDPAQLATPEAFARDPKLVWDWYAWRRDKVSQAQPNPGHYALAELERIHSNVIVITQNVDDLHERAGSRDVIHLHGRLAGNKCSAECQGSPTLIDLAALEDEGKPPACPHCGAPLRPDVVWFGEALPQAALQRAYHISQHCDLMVVIGTSGLVTPAATLPIIAKQSNARLIEINPDDSMLTPHAHLKFSTPSGIALPRIIEALQI